MPQRPIDTEASLSGEVATRELTRLEPAKLFDTVTVSMAMMFLGQTLLIIALVKP